jgi:hypothetical protein
MAKKIAVKGHAMIALGNNQGIKVVLLFSQSFQPGQK